MKCTECVLFFVHTELVPLNSVPLSSWFRAIVKCRFWVYNPVLVSQFQNSFLLHFNCTHPLSSRTHARMQMFLMCIQYHLLTIRAHWFCLTTIIMKIIWNGALWTIPFNLCINALVWHMTHAIDSLFWFWFRFFHYYQNTHIFPFQLEITFWKIATEQKKFAARRM